MNMTAFLGAQFIQLLGRTWRIRSFGEAWLDEAEKLGPALIYAFWHGRLLPLSFTHRRRNVQILASEHRDGETLGRAIRYLGFGHVRGSSSRGGSRAIRELAGKVRAGLDLGLTVDGPKGPKWVVKPGSIEIAKLTGAPIVPITAASKDHWTFSSWDEFQLPKPFTKIRVQYGKPVTVPENAGPDAIEEKRRELQDILTSITEESDAAVR